MRALLALVLILALWVGLSAAAIAAWRAFDKAVFSKLWGEIQAAHDERVGRRADG